jgi:hypothetical protein
LKVGSTARGFGAVLISAASSGVEGDIPPAKSEGHHEAARESRAVCPVPDSETLMFGLVEAKALIVLHRAKR